MGRRRRALGPQCARGMVVAQGRAGEELERGGLAGLVSARFAGRGSGVKIGRGDAVREGIGRGERGPGGVRGWDRNGS